MIEHKSDDPTRKDFDKAVKVKATGERYLTESIDDKNNVACFKPMEPFKKVIFNLSELEIIRRV